MGLSGKFLGKVVYIDTPPLIYYIERNQRYFNLVKEVFEANDRGDFLFVTSSITIAEILSFPNTHKDKELLNIYDKVFQSSRTLLVLPVGFNEARTAGMLRAKHKLKTPDAIHLATATEYKADYFLTNDFDFSGTEQITIINLDSWLKKKK